VEAHKLGLSASVDLRGLFLGNPQTIKRDSSNFLSLLSVRNSGWVRWRRRIFRNWLSIRSTLDAGQKSS
jgi:hypothetical protein